MYWQWLRHIELKAQHQGKPLLLINIDETPIPYHIKPVTGVVKKGFGGHIAVSTNEKRGTASLLATVCNRPSLSLEGVFQMDSILPERLPALVRPAFDLVLRRIRSLKRCVQACGCK